jgi:hypothetical protein
MTRRSTVALVYVRWSENPGDPPLVKLTQHLAREAVSPVATCVVDNRSGLPPAVAESPDLSTIAGDNSEREFSGYDTGVRHLRDRGTSPDLWLLANDRFDAYGLEYLELLTDRSLDVAASLHCALGHVDQWPRPVHLLGFDVSTWARSNLLVIPERSLRSMGSVVSVDARAFRSLLVESAPTPTEVKDPAFVLRGSFDATWSELAAEWLTGRGSRLRSHWYQAAPVDHSNWCTFRGKVHSIVNEQLFSARVRQSGTPVVSLPLASEVADLPETSIRRLTSSAVRRWPTRSAAVAGTRGVVRAVRSCASVETSVRAGFRGVLR